MNAADLFNGIIAGHASAAKAVAPKDDYRGWSICWEYGSFWATGPNYDASYEGPEDGWIASGGQVDARTREALIEEIDAYIEEHPEACA